ncbi:hypothetical protein AMS68_001075 [Peltaster fructicola]|uniref:WW domain-containing protein n=1 Tax=Peltaster fructicola TaxID=286661 RepID=A0A6H0XLR0_9PEZI|nr:hypothetical protein AMS68_001075 [Peltaster fructicola]
MYNRQNERIPETTYTNYGGQGQPQQVPPPWVSRFDQQSQRWYFVNEQTGERSWELPSGFYNGAPNRPYGETTSTATVDQTRGQKHHGSGLGWGMAGAAAGLVGGALLMHEGHEIKEHWREDEYRAEERVDDAARWTGDKVQEVEDIPEDVAQGFDRFGNRVERRFDRFGDRVEQGFDNTVDYVEDTPDRIAGDIGEDVGRVERFGDGIQDSYDEGRYEGRNDYDDRRDNNCVRSKLTLLTAS